MRTRNIYNILEYFDTVYSPLSDIFLQYVLNKSCTNELNIVFLIPFHHASYNALTLLPMLWKFNSDNLVTDACVFMPDLKWGIVHKHFTTKYEICDSF